MIKATNICAGQRLEMTDDMGKFSRHERVSVREIIWIAAKDAYSLTLFSSARGVADTFTVDRNDEIPAVEV